jgi:hypothetical protein
MLPQLANTDKIKGAIFNSRYALPAHPKLPNFPLYHELNSDTRYHTEVAARDPFLNWGIHTGLYLMLQFVHHFDDDLPEFLFFMDGDASARDRYQNETGKPFPIVQQTYVVPTAATETFTKQAMQKLRSNRLNPTECDMLYVMADQCWMSANYLLDGFAVTFAFEPGDAEACPPPKVEALLRDLSVDCLNVGGRIHLPKNLHVECEVFRAMFNDKGQLDKFEALKKYYDPDGILQNPFSDKFFQF